MATAKNLSKIVRSVKGKSSEQKKKAIHKMVESLIADDSVDAQNHLHEYVTDTMRTILLGEEADDSDDKDSDDKEVDDKDSDDKDSDEDSDDKDSDDSDEDDDSDSKKK